MISYLTMVVRGECDLAMQIRAVRMVPPIKVLASKHNGLSSIPKTHLVEAENQLLPFVL